MTATTIYTEDAVLLKVDNVTKVYGETPVLKNVCATVKDIHVTGEVKGQVVGFLGPSGIGKSTLFRIMAGLEKPTSGEVLLNSNATPVEPGTVGVVAQDYPLFAHRTVMGNLIRAAQKTSKTDKEAKDRATSYLSEFDLMKVVDQYPAQLSGGQRQRCAIIQQVLCSSHFILMDEPFSGLDPLAKKKTQTLIQKIADMDELNTIIVVTHDIAAAAAVSDHIWLMGRDHDENGACKPGAYIVGTYNLIDLGLAWTPDIEKHPEFAPFVQEITDRFATL